jgi:hypothetical protein
MPSSLVRHRAEPDDTSQAQNTREFDRWRIATELVQRLRNAGVRCGLNDDLQTRQ